MAVRELTLLESLKFPTKDFRLGLHEASPFFEAMKFVAWKRREAYAVSVRDGIT
jgi:hypothetical protein